MASAAPLSWRSELARGLRAVPAGSGLQFVDRLGHAVLRYGGLSATDATGRRLRVALSVSGPSLSLRVVDRAARYPIRIDPFIQQGSKLTPTGAGCPCSYFGLSLAVSADGSTALIGSGTSGEPGVWVFTRTGGTWTQGQLLTPNDATNGASQAVALSADGSTALIGAPVDTNGSGAAWVFTRSGSTYTQQGSKLTQSDAVGQVGFGASVALSGDGNTAVIGGPQQDGKGVGGAWVFTRSGSTWTPGPELAPNNAAGAARFGTSVALSSDGSTALVGAPYDGNSVGAAWVFARSGSTWAQQGKLLASDETGQAQLGYSVALSSDGGTALIGAPYDDNSVGAAWVFTRSGSGRWGQQGSELAPSDATGSSSFGYSVALSADGSEALIGGPTDNNLIGSEWAFQRTSSGWSQRGPKLVPSDAAGAPRFGWNVAMPARGDSGAHRGRV